MGRLVAVVVSGLMWWGIVALASGCAIGNPAGFEFTASAGLHAVDEREESQKTHAKRIPLKCWFMPCGDVEEAKAS